MKHEPFAVPAWCSPVGGLVVIAVGLLLATWATEATGGSASMVGQLFYFSIVVAALRFGMAGGLVAGLAAGLLYGLLVPLGALGGTAESGTLWLAQSGLFVVAGLAMGLFGRVFTEQAERRVEELERLHEECTSQAETLKEANAELAREAAEHQETAKALAQAYNTTIEGWSRALGLREKETEGHSARVTVMTLRLAQVLGVDEVELVYMRWGALLHDIGKMGVPDAILLKPGPLTEQEWEVMHEHPVQAGELLEPIDFLRSALEIPLFHHEKWDGTGYPHGIRGKQIPLAARIFAVVDVWDALRSDRPYRQGWPETKVLAYLRQEAGKHFDPKVVEVFIRLKESLQDEASHVWGSLEAEGGQVWTVPDSSSLGVTQVAVICHSERSEESRGKP